MLFSLRMSADHHPHSAEFTTNPFRIKSLSRLIAYPVYFQIFAQKHRGVWAAKAKAKRINTRLRIDGPEGEPVICRRSGAWLKPSAYMTLE